MRLIIHENEFKKNFLYQQTKQRENSLNDNHFRMRLLKEIQFKMIRVSNK